MKQSGMASGVGIVLLVTALGVSAQTPQSPAPSSDSVARGAYLATHVAMCVQCHSPRNEKNDIIESLRFTGAAIPFRSPYRNTEWAPLAPNIRGLPGFTDEQIVALLTEGHTGDRPAPRRPMPPFRMAPDDARAIVAFLRTQ